MHTNYTGHYLSKAQHALYAWENIIAEKHLTTARFAAIPIAFLDVGLETLKRPLLAIEHIVMAALNLVGAYSSQKFSIKEALLCVETAGEQAVSTPVALLLAPVKFIYQLVVTVWNPETAKSIMYYQEIGTDNYPVVFSLFPLEKKR